MKDLKVIGKEQVAGYEFIGIEGGFGDGTRGMLVRDIAEIHNKPTYVINQAINMNIKRFTENIDIINLKTNDVAINLIDSGFSRNQINASKYIYLLSERGYSKLLKILEDDTAWDIYDKFVDGYFNMRKHIKEQALPSDPHDVIQTLLLASNDDHKTLVSVVDRLDEFEDAQEIRSWEQTELLRMRHAKVFAILGSKHTKRYQALSSEVYQAISHDFKTQFNVPRYNALPRKRFDEAKRFFQNWEPSNLLELAIKGAEVEDAA